MKKKRNEKPESTTEEQTPNKSPESEAAESTDTKTAPKEDRAHLPPTNEFTATYAVTVKAHNRADAERMFDAKCKKLQKSWGVVAVKQSLS